MKSVSRLPVILLTLPMALGYNPVTDTLGRAFDLDFLSGQSDYYTGCESPMKTITFQEIHAGYKSQASGRITFHVDAAMIPTDVEPVDSIGGGPNCFGYINAGYDINWEYLGLGLALGNNNPVIDPYLRLGSKKILYVDAGIGHRFPMAAAGTVNMGIGTGFGTENFNLWIGTGSGLQVGGLDNSKYNGYSANLDLRVSERVAVKFGGLKGDNNSKSGWFGLRYYFK